MVDHYSSKPKNEMGQAMGTPMESSTELDFTPPADLKLKGKMGTAMVNWKLKPDGKVCITAMDGVSLGAPDQDDTGEPDDGETAPTDEQEA